MNNIIEVNDLGMRYKVLDKPDVVAYSQFNLSIEENAHTICFTGPDGAGKSTLLKLIAGVIKPTHGQLLLNGVRPSNTDPKFTKDIGYMSQTLGLYGELSVYDNLKIFSALRGLDVKKNEDYLLDLLDRVKLLKFKDRAADALSGGMKQKLGLSCAIAPKPKILILDEPTVGVDPVSRQELWDIINKYQRETGSYVIFSTAYLEEAEKADVALMFNQGHVILKGKPEELSDKVKDLTFSVDIGDLNYQRTVREVMSVSARVYKSSPLIDVVPRLSRIDVVSREGESEKTIYEFLKSSLKLETKVSRRKAMLEDSYIYNTFMNENHEAVCDRLNPVQTVPYDQKKTVVKVEGIKKQFGTFTAVRESTFNVHKGEIFGLLGPNGAGKTTTFRMICALLKPTAGKVEVNGYDLRYAKSDARDTIGYVSQKFSLYRNLTVYQNLEYFGLSYALSGKKLKERIDTQLTEFNLKDYKDTRSEHLPFGVQRQLSMACALIHKPKILFLDEATSGADPLARRRFWDKVSALSNEGTSVIVTTHFMDEAEYCDNFLIQDQGKILVLGAPDRICVKDGQRISIEQAFIDQVLAYRSGEDKNV